MLKLKEEKQKLDSEDIDINKKLAQLKVQLDDLIIEKDQIDQEIKKVNNDLQTSKNFVCSHKYMSEDIKHPRENTSDFGDLSKEFESLALKWIQIEEENGGLKENCKQMKSAMPEMESCRADFNTVKLAELEKLRGNKAKLLKKDKSIKKEATNLWIEANSAKKRMEELIGLDVRLDADGKETWELFREINSEREKLIDQDKLLNARYEMIHSDIESICQKRSDIVKCMETSPDELKDSLFKEDLFLAVKQKESEMLFKTWITEKEKIISSNVELDKFLKDLSNKFNLLKQKKQECNREKESLENSAITLQDKFVKNQSMEQKVIEQFKECEAAADNIVANLQIGFNTYMNNKGPTVPEVRNNLLDIKEFELLRQNKLDLLGKNNSLTEKYNFASDNLSVSLAENSGINTEFHDKECLETKKAVLQRKDNEILKKFEEYDRQIEAVQEQKRGLKKKQEEIDWEICVLQNQLEH